MKHLSTVVGLLIVLNLAGAAAPPARLSRPALEDKIRGGWAGQMIGVAYGAPTEFRWRGQIIEDPIGWSPAQIENALHQDDMYVDMTFVRVLERIGLDATAAQFGEAFRDSQYDVFHANAAGRRNLLRGIPPPMSGHPKFNLHANDIDFQIEADFIGLMTPGLAQEATRYADRVGHVMNYGDGVYGGMFVAGMYSAAFTENDPRRIVQAGLAGIPAASQYARVIRDVLQWTGEHPDDWKAVWRRIQDKWDKDDHCPKGALVPYNIDAKLNGAYVAMGLLYGKGDFARTMEVAARCGHDSDCNPSSAGGIVGVMLGYRRIPDQWKAGLPAIADKKFDYTDYSFNEVTRVSLDLALRLIERNGGQVGASEVVIPVQQPQPPPLEQWSPGIPDRRMAARNKAWTWSRHWQSQSNAVSTVEAGAEATLKFQGVAVAILGPCAPDGGQAEVMLDGEKAGVLDAYIGERARENVLWHAYDLKPGDHTLILRTTGKADPRSKGRLITIQTAISYRAPDRPQP